LLDISILSQQKFCANPARNLFLLSIINKPQGVKKYSTIGQVV